VDGAGLVANANMAWLLVRHQESKTFLLTAQRGLPEVWSNKMNMPMEDGVSALVALSGETLAIAGAPLQRFNIVNLGKSVCVVPIKVQSEVIGMLIVVRREARPFGGTEQTLLEAVADYASISLVNARLFRALTDTVHAEKESEQRQTAILETIRGSVTEDLKAALYPVEVLLAGKSGPLREDQKQALQTIRAALQRLGQAMEKITPPVPITLKRK
jgi:GAF domain-containing protein